MLSQFTVAKLSAPVATVSSASAVTVTVELTNAGRVAGAEVVQLYSSLTEDFGSRPDVSNHVPARQLLAFEKVFRVVLMQ